MIETNFRYLNQRNNKKKPVMTMGTLILVIIIVTALFLTRQPTKKVENVVAATIPKETAPIEKPKIDKSTVKIQVINGTGIPGQAKDVIKTLVTAGYSSDNVRSTNAEKFDNVKTTIYMRDTFEETANDIEKILKITFNDVSISSTRIGKYTEYDIIVVTGYSASIALSPQQ